MHSYKEDYIKYRIKKSDEVYDDAILLAKNKRWNSCVNRLYYSCFHLVLALLYKHKIKAHTHNGVKAKFFYEFVKTKKINQLYGKLYSHLMDWRQESDYAEFIYFNEKMVLPFLEKVKMLNNEIKKLI